MKKDTLIDKGLKISIDLCLFLTFECLSINYNKSIIGMTILVHVNEILKEWKLNGVNSRNSRSS